MRHRQGAEVTFDSVLSTFNWEDNCGGTLRPSPPAPLPLAGEGGLRHRQGAEVTFDSVLSTFNWEGNCGGTLRPSPQPLSRSRERGLISRGAQAFYREEIRGLKFRTGSAEVTFDSVLSTFNWEGKAATRTAR